MKPLRYFVREAGPQYAGRWEFYLVDDRGRFTGQGWALDNIADRPSGYCIFVGWPSKPTGCSSWRGPKDCRNLPKGTRRQMAFLLRKAWKERAERWEQPR